MKNKPEKPAQSECNGLLDEALRNTGFDICLFEPDSDSCENCGKAFRQLFFQGPTDAGRYYCAECIIAEYKNNLKQYGI